MTNRTRRKESDFSRYLRRIVAKDPESRALLLAEMKGLPLASQRRVLQHFRFLNDHPSPSK